MPGGSTQDQHPALQLDALHATGCAKVFVEQASGAQRDRPQLQAAVDSTRSGDTLVVWKLDRLARSLKQLIETIEILAVREMGFRSLTEVIETTTAGLGGPRAHGRQSDAGGSHLHGRRTWRASGAWCHRRSIAIFPVDGARSATGGPDEGDCRARLRRAGGHGCVRTRPIPTSP